MDEIMKLKLVNTVIGVTATDYNSDQEAEKIMNGIFEQPVKEVGTYLKNMLDATASELPEEMQNMTIFDFLEMVYSQDDDE